MRGKRGGRMRERIFVRKNFALRKSSEQTEFSLILPLGKHIHMHFLSVLRHNVSNPRLLNVTKRKTALVCVLKSLFYDARALSKDAAQMTKKV